MASNVDIANLSLRKIGETRINALDDNTPQATVVNSVYQQVRDREIAKRLWKFAATRAALAALSTPPLFGYQYQYVLPADCQRVLEVVDAWSYLQPGDPPFRIEGRAILTDMPAPLKIRYASIAKPESEFSALFVDVLACALAIEIAPSLRPSDSKGKQLRVDYRESLRDASRAHALENAPFMQRSGSWESARWQ